MNQFRQAGHAIQVADAVIQIIPEREPQLAAGFHQTGKGIPRLSSPITAGGPTDFAPFDVFADVLFTEIVMERDLRAL